MADNTIPQSWDELKQAEGFDGIPDLKPATDFTASDSARFTVAATGLQKRIDSLRKLGANGKRQYDVEEASILMAEGIEYANRFVKSVAVSETAWDEWTKGRTATDLLNLLVTLLSFYADELGKSSESKTHSGTAGSK